MFSCYLVCSFPSSLNKKTVGYASNKKAPTDISLLLTVFRGGKYIPSDIQIHSFNLRPANTDKNAFITIITVIYTRQTHAPVHAGALLFAVSFASITILSTQCKSIAHIRTKFTIILWLFLFFILLPPYYSHSYLFHP